MVTLARIGIWKYPISSAAFAPASPMANPFSENTPSICKANVSWPIETIP